PPARRAARRGMATSCYAGESGCYRAASDVQSKIDEYLSNGFSKQESELKGVENFAIECSILKVGVSEDMQNCADEGIQIFGGMGFSAEIPMESAWRDARISRIYEGTNEINRMLMVGMLLKKAKKGELDLMSALQNTMNDNNENNVETIDELKHEMNIVNNLKKVFLIILGKAFEKYDAEIEKNQQVLLALSDIMIETYLSESTLKRTIKNINRSNVNDQYYQIEMAKLYIYEASQITLKKSKDIIISIYDTQLQEELLAKIKELVSYEENPNIFNIKKSIADKIISENKYCF
ncbi:MAG: acyl-CoA dehydrogenase family protein, partial [Flavobacteriaceae bacterium]